jgi:hypothetical protein
MIFNCGSITCSTTVNALQLLAPRILHSPRRRRASWRALSRYTKQESGGRNFLRGIDVLGLVLDLCFYPTCRIQEFTYSLAKRRSRNLWPNVVTERLKANGPSSRLVDLMS